MSNTKICTLCESENELGAKHCEVCGEPLPIPQAGAPASSAVVEPGGGPTLETPAVTPEATASAGFAWDEPAPANPSAPEARDHIDAAQPSSPDAMARDSLRGEAPRDPDADDRAALDKFDELLHAPIDDDTAADARAGFAREGQDTIVDHPAVTREAVAASRPATDVDTTPATLVVYHQRQPVHTHDIVHDETLVGRADPNSDAWPELDLTRWDADSSVSRKHAFILREGGKYYVRPISTAGTQINRHMLDIGDKVELEDGDVVILGGAVAMKFQLT